MLMFVPLYILLLNYDSTSEYEKKTLILSLFKVIIIFILEFIHSIQQDLNLMILNYYNILIIYLLNFITLPMHLSFSNL